MSDYRTVARLRLEKAKFLLSELDVLMQNKFYNNAISRLYYSCFYATQALLLIKDFMPKTHKGVISVLNEHFVKSGEFDIDKAIFLSKLFNERIQDDYNQFLILDEAEIIEFIEPAKEYIEYVSKLIDNYFAAQ